MLAATGMVHAARMPGLQSGDDPMVVPQPTKDPMAEQPVEVRHNEPCSEDGVMAEGTYPTFPVNTVNVVCDHHTWKLALGEQCYRPHNGPELGHCATPLVAEMDKVTRVACSGISDANSCCLAKASAIEASGQKLTLKYGGKQLTSEDCCSKKTGKMASFTVC